MREHLYHGGMASGVPPRSNARRWGAGTAAVARLLIASDVPLTGVAIARTAGITQPRASQVLRRLADHGAVRATETGYVGRPDVLFDLYEHRARPRLLQPERYWYATPSMGEQGRRVATLASEHGSTVAVSADLGPDLLVPWRHPTVTVVYADHDLDLTSARFVHAEGRADASVIMRWTDDATLLAPSTSWPSEVDAVPLADPVQQWWDLLDLGGEERCEAADRLRQAIVERTIAT